MQNIFIALLLILGLGGGWWFIFGEDTKSVANMQTATSMADLFAYNTNAGAQPAAVSTTQQPVITTAESTKNYMQAILHTNEGDITIEFFDKDAPNTVANFTKLASSGFYDGTKFHRIIAGFMIQGGDPLTKDDSAQAMWGTGGPGYKFADEIHANNKNVVGTISMANAGPNTNGSQFFINVANNNFLDSKHTVFGKVVAGMDVVEKLQGVATGQADRPVTPVVVSSITLK